MPQKVRQAWFVLTLASAVLAQSSTATDNRKAAPLSELPNSPSLDVTSMDRNADPCANFYQYACGGWIKKNPIPPDQEQWEVYGKLHYENQLFLWGILEEAAKPAAGRSAEQQKIGDYFESCMDEAAIEQADLAPIKPGLDEIALVSSVRELAALVGGEHLNGTSTLFSFGSNQDFEDS